MQWGSGRPVFPVLPAPAPPPRGPTVVVRPDAPRWPPPARMRCSSVRGGKNPLATPGNSPGERSREVSRRIQEMWCGHHTIEVGVMWPSLPPVKPVPPGALPRCLTPPWAAVPGGGGPAGGKGGARGGTVPSIPFSQAPGPSPSRPTEVVARAIRRRCFIPLRPWASPPGARARARAGGRAGSRAPRSAGGSGGPAGERGGGRCGALRALTARTQAPRREAGRGGTLDGRKFSFGSLCRTTCGGEKGEQGRGGGCGSS